VDAAVAAPGTYKLGTAGSFQTLAVSIARTVGN
jgi:hypothetical protein